MSRYLTIFLILWIPLFLFAQQQDYTLHTTDDNLLLQRKADTNAILKLIKQGNDLIYKQPDSAVLFYKEAIKYSQLCGYYSGIGKSLINIGSCYVITGNYQQGIYFYRKALALCAMPGYPNQKELIDFCINISVPYFNQGKNDSALAYLIKGLHLAVRISDTSRMIHLYANISGLWAHNQLYEKSAQYAQKAISLALLKKDTPALFQLYGIMATNSIGHREKSLDYTYKAMDLAVEKHQKIALLGKMGEIFLKHKMPDSTIFYLQQRLRLSSDQNQMGRLDVYSNLGKAYHLRHQPETALHYMTKALEAAEASGARNMNLAFTWYNLADILRSMGRYREANGYLIAYTDLIDSLLDAERNKALYQLDVKYRTAEKDRQLVAQQLQLVTAQQKVADRNSWITAIIAGLLIIVAIGFILYRNLRHQQRHQKNTLLLLQQQKELSLLKAGIQGEEKERARIAYELHDGIGGMLAAIKMNFGAVQERYATLYGLNELNPIMRMVEEATDELRKTAHNLMPGILLKHSLSEALRVYCSNIHATGKLHISLRLYGRFDNLPKTIELMLYRMAQELIQNIIKHAQATYAVLELEHKNGHIHLLVEDNGRGFDPDTKTGNGLGLENLHTRIRALQGCITVESAPGRGTTINITFDNESVKSAFADL